MSEAKREKLTDPTCYVPSSCAGRQELCRADLVCAGMTYSGIEAVASQDDLTD
jgi:hypothetical protein